jgi:amino acid adenylation domain-containing protein
MSTSTAATQAAAIAGNGAPREGLARHAIALPPTLTRAMVDEVDNAPVKVAAGVAALLARYTGEEDLTLSLRLGDGGAGDLRIDLSDNPTLRTVQVRVAQAGSGLFGPSGEGGPLRLAFPAPVGIAGQGGAPPELVLVFTGEAHGAIEYDPGRCDPDAVSRLADHFGTLLGGALENPEQPISQLPLLSEVERHQLIEGWNDTRADYPRGLRAHQLFEQQAARVPGRPAVLFDGRQWTYAELNTRANQLARHLQSLGVGPGALVGLCADRSPEMVAGLLAILKAGAAYVPLDPAFPPDRLAFYIADSKMPVLVTQEPLLDRLPRTGARQVLLDRDWPEIARQATDNLPATSSPEDLAYVIFTSGSTGKPKGVQVPQQALLNFLVSMTREPGLAECDVLLSVTTISFDIHALELWLPLAVGARVALVSREEAADGDRLIRRLDEYQATVLQGTPATWRLLLAAGWKGVPGLKAFCGGEPLTPELAGQLLDRVGELWNLYGPTETTVYSTAYHVREVLRPTSIGRPIANTTVYVLDRQLNLVPPGGIGELHIGGDGVARGYLNRPELSAEKFLPDPFRPGERIYKSGDRARFRPDGNLECLGRIDFQVKVRGFRIEIGEIETVLAQHAVVRTAVVIAHKSESGADYLVAYVIPREGADASAGVLRPYLLGKLPDYMVPNYYVALAAFPLTPNNKVDRKALPPPDLTQASDDRRTVAPRDDAERDLAAIWEEVLNVKPVGITDNFFDLGGHSFLAAVMTTKVKQKLGHELPLGALLTAPTVEQLAGILKRQLEAGTDTSIVPLNEKGNRPPLFMIAGVGGHVFTFHKFARLLGPDQPVYGVKAIGVEGERSPYDRMEDIAAHYAREILAVRPKGPYVLAGYSIGAIVAFELALHLTELGHQVEGVHIFDMYAPGYPPRLPLSRRLLMHWQNFAAMPWKEKALYLGKRISNVKVRLFAKLGLDRFNAPRMELLKGHSEDALRSVWIGLMTAQGRYLPRRAFPGRALLMCAGEGFHWPATVFDDPLLGWGRWVTGGIERHIFAGGHNDLFADLNLGPMATAVAESIGRSRGH